MTTPALELDLQKVHVTGIDDPIALVDINLVVEMYLALAPEHQATARRTLGELLAKPGNPKLTKPGKLLGQAR